ncbi:extracellular solute-binding protein [Metabacillus halosaccharovorans]|uniref:extracellular solute-binding protein n=1 Tax=Metabacillus halosaccharovorans TaxID=930124 RepID=UPI00203CB28A|nr:extracellular solute-binding protein [Metabacillus halosaccharovorans]MCM3443666.1 extracellular solute-binding protein [Metabacillus halosaccharovorans]
MRKSILLVFLSMILVLMSACQEQSANTEVEKGKESGTSESVDNVVWFSTVDFWTPPTIWDTDPNTVTGAITEKTGLSFEFNIPAQEGETKLSLMMVSSKQIPDVMTITNPDLAKKLIESDLVWDMEEFLKEYDPESHLLKEFPEDIKQVLVDRDGAWYSFPSHISSEKAREIYPPSSEFYLDGIKYRNNGAFMVNENILAEIGLTLDDLKTEDDVLAAFQKIKDMDLKVDGAKVIPLQVDGAGYQNTTLADLQNMFGAMPVDEDGAYRDPLLAPQTKDALKFLNKAIKAGYFDQGQMTMDAAGIKAAVTSGRVFSFIGNTANTDFQTQDNWASPGPILSNDGNSPVLGKSYRAGGGWMQTYISKKTEHPEKLAKWLSFMSSEEGMKLHYFGLEGEHYDVDADGLIVQSEAGKKAALDFSKTGVSAFWPFHNISWHNHATPAPTEETGTDGQGAMQVQTAFGKAPETVIYDNSVLTLPADFIPVGSDMARDQEQIDVFKEAQISKIILAKDDTTFEQLYDELITTVKELGIEAIDSKKNEQLQKLSKDYDVKLEDVNANK